MKNKHLFKIGALVVTTGALCSCGINKTGQYAYMFKLTGNHYGEVLRTGFFEFCEQKHLGYFEKTPAEANVGDQIQMIETLILQNVKAITVSAAGTTGYDNVLKQANDKGIKVVSVDSPISPKYRVTHIDHVKPDDAGQWMAWASIMISHGISFKKYMDWISPSGYKHENDDLGDFLDSKDEGSGGKILEELAKKSGYKKKRFGYISSTQDSPSQNEWMHYCTEELKNPNYSSYVDSKNGFEIKYGNDEPIESKKCANAFIETKSVDVILAPTSVAMAAAGQALKQAGETHIKLTGLGMPSEMWDYMPKKKDFTDEFNAVCPYMCLWDVRKFGSIAGAATLAAVNGTFDGKEGSTFRDADDKEHKAIKSDDGGTKVIALTPLPFCADNIDYYKDRI